MIVCEALRFTSVHVSIYARALLSVEALFGVQVVQMVRVSVELKRISGKALPTPRPSCRAQWDSDQFHCMQLPHMSVISLRMNALFVHLHVLTVRVNEGMIRQYYYTRRKTARPLHAQHNLTQRHQHFVKLFIEIF